MRVIFSFLILLIFFPSNGQQLFVQGTELLRIGNYGGADSLLTMAMCSYRHANVFFNRGLARLGLHDTIGYCYDMNYAANRFLDSEASKLFNTNCCKRVDTIYYDRKYNNSNAKRYRYYEIIQVPIYDSIKYGKIHDKIAYYPTLYFDIGCDQNLVGLQTLKTSIIAAYEFIDTVKYYYLSTKRPKRTNPDKLQKIRESARMFFNTKYASLKNSNYLENLTIYFQIIISPAGEVSRIENITSIPEIDLSSVITELKNDLFRIVTNYPKYTPAVYRRERVYYKMYDYIEY